MRKALVSLFILFSSCLNAHAQSPDGDDFSRDELFSIVRFEDTGATDYSLPTKFTFPNNARSSSTFGVDISHHVHDDCKCEIDWSTVAGEKAQFVYLKATQGSSYIDPTVEKDLQALRTFGKLDTGVYHFISSTEDASAQAAFFVSQLRRFGRLQLVPSVDLEWHLFPISSDCPSDAIVRIKRHDGSVLQRCDYWYKLTASQIIDVTNTVIDAIKKETGKEPLLYTNAAWFAARVGSGERLEDIHTKLMWIADYSKDGLATENPKVPGRAPWAIWQFSENALASVGSKGIHVDASIYDGSMSSLEQQIGSLH